MCKLIFNFFKIKIMKKTILGLIAIAFATFLFTSCEKDQLQDTFEQEVGNEYATVVLPSSNYQSRVAQTLTNVEGSPYYTGGVIEYVDNGEVIATVNFGDANQNDEAMLTMNGTTSKISLKQNQTSSSFSKIIIKPLVKIPGCDFIVEGIIKYVKNGDTIAAIDFGDGTCDEFAFKTWIDKNNKIQTKKFSLKKWKKKHKKGGKKGHGYKKLVVKPIVKDPNCAYNPVSGTIKYFDAKKGNWLATVDFGDGTCDTLATKITAKGDTINFHVDDFK